jgi:hypothetical protein
MFCARATAAMAAMSKVVRIMLDAEELCRA